MRYSQLALLRHALEDLAKGKMPEITDNNKIDLDYLANYYDNLISDIEKDKKKNPKRELQNFLTLVEVNK